MAKHTNPIPQSSEMAKQLAERLSQQFLVEVERHFMARVERSAQSLPYLADTVARELGDQVDQEIRECFDRKLGGASQFRHYYDAVIRVNDPRYYRQNLPWPAPLIAEFAWIVGVIGATAIIFYHLHMQKPEVAQPESTQIQAISAFK